VDKSSVSLSGRTVFALRWVLGSDDWHETRDACTESSGFGSRGALSKNSWTEARVAEVAWGAIWARFAICDEDGDPCARRGNSGNEGCPGMTIGSSAFCEDVVPPGTGWLSRRDK